MSILEYINEKTLDTNIKTLKLSPEQYEEFLNNVQMNDSRYDTQNSFHYYNRVLILQTDLIYG